MSSISRTYTFTDGTAAYGSQVESEISNIVNTWNSHDAGTSVWTIVNAASFKKSGTTFPPILQYIVGTSTTSSINSTTTYAATNLTASITPVSLTSKILVFLSGTLASNSSSAGIAVAATLARGGANILTAAGFAQTDVSTSAGVYIGMVPASFLYLDSPASLSAQSYSVQIKVVSGTSQAIWGSSSITQYMLLCEVGS